MCRIRKEKLQNIGLLLYSMVLLSGWSSYIIFELLGMRFFVYEIFLLPFILRAVLKMNGRIKMRKTESAAYIFIFLCFLAGLLRNPAYLSAHVTTFRTIIYYIVIIHIVSRAETISMSKMKILALGGTIGDLLYMMTVHSREDHTAVNLIALMILVTIPILEGRIMQSFVFALLAMVTAVRSSFRIAVLIVITGVFLSVLYMSAVKKNVKCILLLCIFMAGTAVIIVHYDSLPVILSRYLHMNEYSVYRITARMKYFFLGRFDVSEDDIRRGTFTVLYDRFASSILPKGLIAKGAGYYGNYKDSPMIFLYDAFGSPAAWFIAGLFLFKGFRVLHLSLKCGTQKKQFAFLGLTVISFILLLFINGCFLMDTYEVCLAAVIFGYWFHPGIVKLRVKESL